MDSLHTICPNALAGLLDRLPAGVTTISLDCFDTLIWRATHAPVDVFAGLAMPGGAIGPRTWSEGTVRRIAAQRDGRGEIRIEDVYRHLHVGIGEAAIADAVAAELTEEARHAYAFAPVVELVREASRRGLRVVIVSDMYLSEAQLRAHIAAAAGAEVLALIDHVFVSADHGFGKGAGLFDVVLATLGAAPREILHIGDNRAADLDGARRHGLHALHLRQFDAESEMRLRHEAVAATMIDPTARASRPVYQPHRAAVALRRSDDAAYTLGHDVVGPAIHGFALWLKEELDAMTARLGKPVRPLFLMRDGHLPMAAFDALYPEAGAAGVEISRFVAMRTSLADDAAIDTYLSDWLPRLSIEALARQLMLMPEDVRPILRIADRADAEAAFAALVRKPDMRRKILKRMGGFAARFEAHLAAAGVRHGDAVMLVDLGYNGTVQNLVTPMLEARMGLNVAGRYLLLREGRLSGLDKRGMLDVRRHDARALHALAVNVALFEQLCNVEQGSTVDFAADGTPIREKPDMKAEHNAVRAAVQAACLDYVRSAEAGIHRRAASDDLDARIDGAAAALARLFFMPNAREAALFATFNFDPNMGSNQSSARFDAAGAEQGLRRFGLPYLNASEGMYAPGEIQAKGLPLALALFATTRFAMDLRVSDFDTGGVPVPVLLLGGTDASVVERPAYPTMDGFYRIDVPVAIGHVPGVQFGHACEWVQIEEVLYRPALPKADAVPEPAAFVTDAMEAMAPGLYRADPTGLLMAPPPTGVTEPQMLTVVFRPVRWRRDAASPAQALAA